MEVALVGARATWGDEAEGTVLRLSFENVLLSMPFTRFASGKLVGAVLGPEASRPAGLAVGANLCKLVGWAQGRLLDRLRGAVESCLDGKVLGMLITAQVLVIM